MINSTVEENLLRKSGRKLRYEESENVGVVELPAFPALGKVKRR